MIPVNAPTLALPRWQGREWEGVSAALHQHRQDRLQMIVGEFLELLVGAVLDRMGNEHQSRVDTERLGLGGGTFDELGGGDAYRWNAACFEIRHVMRTA